VDFAGPMAAHMNLDHHPLQAIKATGSTTGFARLGCGAALKAGESACQLAIDAGLTGMAGSHVAKAISIIRIGPYG
jgi:hypothetical protein